MDIVNERGTPEAEAFQRMSEQSAAEWANGERGELWSDIREDILAAR